MTGITRLVIERVDEQFLLEITQNGSTFKRIVDVAGAVSFLCAFPELRGYLGVAA